MINQLRRIPVLLQLILIFGGSAFIILLPLFVHSTFVSGPDVGTHIFSSQQFSNAMHEGSWYPRWFGGWYGGYGAPIGVAYPPLLYYGVGILRLINIQTIAALKIVLWISLTVSGIFTYKLVRLNGLPLAAVIAALFYQAAPYRLIDLYERTALPEFFAFLWIPIITFFALSWVQERKFTSLLFLAISFAALICTHSMIAYIFGFFLIGLLVCILTTRQALFHRWSTVIGIVAALVLGVMLAAIYILPALIESQYMFPEWLSAGGINVWGDYRHNFIFGAQIYLTTAFTDLYKENIYIGVSAIISVLIGVIAIILAVITWKQRQVMARNITILMILTLVVSVFMSSSISAPLWSILPKAENIAFPWRWQTLTVFSCSYLVGDIVHALLSYRIANNRLFITRRVAIMFFSLSLAVSFIFSSWFIWRANRIFMPQETVDELTGSSPLQISKFDWVFDPPYRPQWGKDYDYASKLATLNPIEVDSSTELKIDEWYSQQRLFSVSAPNTASVNIRTFWFPGWVAFVNNKPTPIDISPVDGTMIIHVPEGKSEVRLIFENTQIRDISTLVSLVGILGVLLTMAYIVYGYTQSRYGNSTIRA